MAELIAQGGLSAAAHPVTGDPTHERGLFTRQWVRSLLGLPPDAEISAHPVRADDGRPDGYVFAQRAAAAHAGGKLANLRASCACGWLVFGPAVRTAAADPIEWKPGA
jgi:hypothetical protein